MMHCAVLESRLVLWHNSQTFRDRLRAITATYLYFWIKPNDLLQGEQNYVVWSPPELTEIKQTIWGPNGPV